MPKSHELIVRYMRMGFNVFFMCFHISCAFILIAKTTCDHSDEIFVACSGVRGKFSINRFLLIIKLYISPNRFMIFCLSQSVNSSHNNTQAAWDLQFKFHSSIFSMQIDWYVYRSWQSFSTKSIWPWDNYKPNQTLFRSHASAT